MTQAELTFFRRRLREELRSANTVRDAAQCDVHMQWAQYFSGRLEGRRMVKPAVPFSGPICLQDLAA